MTGAFMFLPFREMKEAACVRAARCRTRGRCPSSSPPEEGCRLPATSLFLMRSVHGCVTDCRGSARSRERDPIWGTLVLRCRHRSRVARVVEDVCQDRCVRVLRLRVTGMHVMTRRGGRAPGDRLVVQAGRVVTG